MASSTLQPPENVVKATVPVSEAPSEAVSGKIEVTEPEKFQPGWRFLAAFGSLCIITLMAALDATSISVALPVSSLRVEDVDVATKQRPDHGQSTRRIRH